MRTSRGLWITSLTIAVLMPASLIGGRAAGLPWNWGIWVIFLGIPLFFLGVTCLTLDIISVVRRRRP